MGSQARTFSAVDPLTPSAGKKAVQENSLSVTGYLLICGPKAAAQPASLIQIKDAAPEPDIVESMDAQAKQPRLPPSFLAGIALLYSRSRHGEALGEHPSGTVRAGAHFWFAGSPFWSTFMLLAVFG